MIQLSKYVRSLVESISYEDPHDTTVDYYDDLNRIVKESDINILQDMELNTIAIKDGKCVGALYTSYTHPIFGFDVIVDKNERNQGIGTALFDIGMREYKYLKFDIEDVVLKLKTVNPNWVQHHLRRGLKIINKYGNTTIMTI